MSKNARLTIRIDNELKTEAQRLFNNLGMDMSTAINIFLAQAVRYQGFPFELTLNTPNEITMNAITDSLNNSDIVGHFDSVSALTEDLNA